jgi:hypothetical protein
MQSFLILNRPWQGTGNASEWTFTGADEKALRGCLDQLSAFETRDVEDRWRAAIAFGSGSAWRGTPERGWTIDGALALADALPVSLADLREDLIASFALRKAGWQGDASTPPSTRLSYDFNKGKTPRGASWPLRRSHLDTALVDAAVGDLVGIVYYWLGTRWRDENPPLMWLRYHGTAGSGFYAGRVAITVWAVPSTMRMEAESRMLATVLPDACAWIGEIRTRPATWRSEDADRLYRFEPAESSDARER